MKHREPDFLTAIWVHSLAAALFRTPWTIPG